MTPDRDDPLLDACLEEVLGGRTPPDLTARVMKALTARILVEGQAADGQPQPSPVLSKLERAVMPADADGQPLVALNLGSTGARNRKQRRGPVWMRAAVALASIGLVLALGVGLLVVVQRSQVADNSENNEARGAVAAVSPTKQDGNSESDRQPPRGATPPATELPDASKVVQQPPSSSNSAATQLARGDVPSVSIALPATSAPVNRRRDPSPDAEIISFVNAELARSWSEARVRPSPPATDAEWCRRLFVRVLGRIPTTDELLSFVNDKSAGKREKFVKRLLNDDQYVEEYARHWSVVWSNILIGRTGGRGNSAASREGLEQYLRTALVRNKPYNEMVADFITATGSGKPGSEDYNPAANFLLDGFDNDATLATARVARVFLGQQLQCAQCHNHPTQDWSQEQFWAFNSFFRQMKVQQQGNAARLVNVDFPGQGRSSAGGEVFYETPAGLLKTAFPRFIDGTQIPPSGELAQVDRRRELARFVVQSDLLPKALVNRVWSHFFGYGFTRPVDDLGPNTSPSQPRVLDRLAQEFAARDYDLKSVIRWAALSDPFARSSKTTDLASKDMPEAGEVALFSRYYSRQMQAEEVYNSLAQAAQIRRTASNVAAIEKARVDWLAQFNRNMGTDDAQEESHFSGGVRQSLIMMNGDLMRQAVSSEQGGLLKSVATSGMKFDKKVEHLFLAAISRQPTRREQDAAARILSTSKGNQITALEDTWWAILNSNEFILDH